MIILERSTEKCNFEYDSSSQIQFMLGDARKLDLEDESVDLICTHPTLRRYYSI